eukprot:TRINITY_DN1324_c0_g2_i2.p1 TRINITY_DN1324_c0_g2~~TRINITY_DN1324_c0_g2_i2.p1  ORF type:complete len:295 (-),score=58.43 TRINITY_DN1324_c0_g2_i2:63-947(-)
MTEIKRDVTMWGGEDRCIREQIESLTPAQMEAFNELKARWEAQSEHPIEFDDFMLLRFIRNSPGKYKFNVDSAYKVLQKYEKWSVSWGGLHLLKISDVRAQLEKHQTILLPDSCRTREGHQIVYVRISRHVPKEDPIKPLIKSLAYVLDQATRREKSCTEGVVFLQDFSDVGWKHFSLSDLRAIGSTLQGTFPIRLRQIVAVNVPSIFSVAFSLARPLMTEDFQSKIHVLSNVDDLVDLMAGDSYAARLACLPSDLGGELDVDDVAEEFIRYRYNAEGLDHGANFPSIEEMDDE